MEQCSQCERAAIGKVTDAQIPLCIDHYFTFIKAGYLQLVMAASNLNYINQRLWASSGGLIPLTQYNLPQPTFLQEAPTFNTIKINHGTIGMLNTGTISNLQDVEFTVELLNSQGQDEIAKAISELTQAVINSSDISRESKEEISQQLKFIAAQISAKPEARQTGLIKAILTGIRTNIATVAALVTIIDKVEPIIRKFLGA
ncbi:MAG: hypothetical protein PHU08_07040 [Dehalococcoidales bacterium]|nr:hypothetical protein [Dehalococcoidales bacterium]